MNEKDWKRVRVLVHELQTYTREWKEDFDPEMWDSLPLGLRDGTTKFLLDLESWIEETKPHCLQGKVIE